MPCATLRPRANRPALVARRSCPCRAAAGPATCRLPCRSRRVGGDEAGVLVADHGPVQHDDGRAGVEQPGQRIGDGLDVLGADDHHLDVAIGESLELGLLLDGIVLCVHDDQPQIRVLGGRRLDVGLHLHPPRIVQARQQDADRVRPSDAPRPALGGAAGRPQPDSVVRATSRSRRGGPCSDVSRILPLLGFSIPVGQY